MQRSRKRVYFSGCRRVGEEGVKGKLEGLDIESSVARGVRVDELLTGTNTKKLGDHFTRLVTLGGEPAAEVSSANRVQRDAAKVKPVELRVLRKFQALYR